MSHLLHPTGSLQAGACEGSVPGASCRLREAPHGGGSKAGAARSTVLLQVFPRKLNTRRALEQPGPGGLATRPSRIPVRRKAAATPSLPELISSSTAALRAPVHSCTAPSIVQSTPAAPVPTALVQDSSAAPAPVPLPVPPAPCVETPVPGSKAPSVEQLLGEGLHSQVRPRGGSMAHVGGLNLRPPPTRCPALQCPQRLSTARPVLRSYCQLLSFCAEG
ncbi:UNVERIFIED_CONTAM: hypothetical protein H355_010776 [Colinus virginianus]|nr:hypothetical protein H355_010776 [Colinus virginianus]